MCPEATSVSVALALATGVAPLHRVTFRIIWLQIGQHYLAYRGRRTLVAESWRHAGSQQTAPSEDPFPVLCTNSDSGIV